MASYKVIVEAPKITFLYRNCKNRAEAEEQAWYDFDGLEPEEREYIVKSIKRIESKREIKNAKEL